MTTFTRSTIIEAPVETVFGFHERADALPLLSPAFPPVTVVRATGGIQPGATVELSVAGIPWLARHSRYERNRLFVDEQIRGPFAAWVHRHEFEDLGGRTRLTDRVSFQLPGGAIANTLLGPFVRLGLHQMFRQRHAVTRRHCERGL